MRLTCRLQLPRGLDSVWHACHACRRYQERAASRQPKRIHSMGEPAPLLGSASARLPAETWADSVRAPAVLAGDGLSGTRDGKGSLEMGDEEDGETRVLLSDASAVLSHQPKK